jgi:hypothetical protein
LPNAAVRRDHGAQPERAGFADGTVPITISMLVMKVFVSPRGPPCSS